MGKISEVYYERIDESDCDPMIVNASYFFYNLIGVHDMFDRGYEDNEMKILNTRNRLTGRAINDNKSLDVHSALFGLSSIHDQPILVIERR